MGEIERIAITSEFDRRNDVGNITTQVDKRNNNARCRALKGSTRKGNLVPKLLRVSRSDCTILHIGYVPIEEQEIGYVNNSICSPHIVLTVLGYRG